ncbi:unnamed protein product [Phaedon cochleariae]|uniref:folate gamma-glutamyl hydrolase n=1 Tax=Phaedon cochleariae TaxID=80249 RepID=A0A9P0DJ00_PHACE|nr:unnamed protein product [Phaedon cochleariae]
MLRLLLILAVLGANHATNRPIIGIITQPMDNTVNQYQYDTYIAASYVKFLELAGARVMPIWLNQTTDYYRRVVKYTNGVLFPGGSAPFDTPGGYGEAAREIYKLAVEANDQGIYYPLWGTCLGFEVLPFAETGIDLRVSCLMEEVGIPLDFVPGFKDSRMYQEIPDHLVDILVEENVTFNYHELCFTRQSMYQHGALKWRTLSTNIDSNGLNFISSFEHEDYPFYGVQFHPEKPIFEFKEGVGIPHTVDSIQVAQYYSNFFVNEARKNDNAFPNSTAAVQSLIYNFCASFTAVNNSYYFQSYGFHESDYSNLLI